MTIIQSTFHFPLKSWADSTSTSKKVIPAFKDMAIFGDVNDNRVIPLILMSGLIFLAGMYIFYIYRWIRNFLLGRGSKSSKISNTHEFPPIDPFIHLDMERKQSMQWDPDSAIVIFQSTVKSISEEDNG